MTVTVMVMVHVVLRRGHVELHVAIIATTVRLRVSEHFRWRRNEWVALGRVTNHPVPATAAADHAVVVVVLR